MGGFEDHEQSGGLKGEAGSVNSGDLDEQLREQLRELWQAYEDAGKRLADFNAEHPRQTPSCPRDLLEVLPRVVQIANNALGVAILSTIALGSLAISVFVAGVLIYAAPDVIGAIAANGGFLLESLVLMGAAYGICVASTRCAFDTAAQVRSNFAELKPDLKRIFVREDRGAARDRTRFQQALWLAGQNLTRVANGQLLGPSLGLEPGQHLSLTQAINAIEACLAGSQPDYEQPQPQYPPNPGPSDGVSGPVIADRNVYGAGYLPQTNCRADPNSQDGHGLT